MFLRPLQYERAAESHSDSVRSIITAAGCALARSFPARAVMGAVMGAAAAVAAAV